MNIIIVLLVIIALLFTTAYFTKRRFGVLGLALTAGYLLSTMWTADVTPLVRQAGLELVAPPLATVVSVVLILLPAIVLLFSGPTYPKGIRRLIGAAAFALLATAFLLSPLSNGLALDGNNQKLYMTLYGNRNIIITVAIVYALFDILTLKAPKAKEE